MECSGRASSHLPAPSAHDDTSGARPVAGAAFVGQGILGIDSDVRNGFSGIKVTYKIDADASRSDIEALVAQSQKRSAVYDIITNPTNVVVEVA